MGYDTVRNSAYTNHHAPKMHQMPSRFDPYIDARDANKPGPSSYYPSDVLVKS